MRIFAQIKNFILSSAVLFSFIFVLPFSGGGHANAQNYHYKQGHGVVLGNGALKRPARTKRQIGTVHRSGVVLRKQSKHYQKPYKYNRVEQRQRTIALRNERVLRENELKKLRASTRRSGPNGRFLSRSERAELFNDGIFDSEFIPSSGGALLNSTSECPSNHNCGYRLYENGTGPRIITPGVQLGNDLPAFDGLNGPKIIRLD